MSQRRRSSLIDGGASFASGSTVSFGLSLSNLFYEVFRWLVPGFGMQGHLPGADFTKFKKRGGGGMPSARVSGVSMGPVWVCAGSCKGILQGAGFMRFKKWKSSMVWRA
jgi:hypothetical protein